MAVNGFVIDARWNTVDVEIGTLRSRLAIPYPCSYSTSPSRLAPTPHPGESVRSHAANI